MLKMKVFDAKSEAIYSAKLDLAKRLKELKESNAAILLCLSGGSALEILKGFDYTVLGPHVTLTVLDERYSTDPIINNMAQIYATGFVEEAKKRGCGVIDTRILDKESMSQLVIRFNDLLAQWFDSNPSGVVIATAGMGPDGHTSGIIPGSDNFADFFMKESKNYVVGYKAANQSEDRNLRVSTTFNFLRKIDFVVLLILGQEKNTALERVMRQEGRLEETPARIWSETKGQTILFTDIMV